MADAAGRKRRGPLESCRSEAEETDRALLVRTDSRCCFGLDFVADLACDGALSGGAAACAAVDGADALALGAGALDLCPRPRLGGAHFTGDVVDIEKMGACDQLDAQSVQSQTDRDPRQVHRRCSETRGWRRQGADTMEGGSGAVGGCLRACQCDLVFE